MKNTDDTYLEITERLCVIEEILKSLTYKSGFWGIDLEKKIRDIKEEFYHKRMNEEWYK